MRQITILAAAAAALLALTGCGKAAPSVPQMSDADFDAKLKQSLLAHPEVLAEAFTELERREKAKEDVKLAGFSKKFASEPGDPTLGPKDAKITMVEFFDYNCGHCREAYPWMFQQLDAKSNDVRVVFKEFPILAPSSIDAAKAALAANKQGKYREMHLALMHSHDLSPAGIEKSAQSVGLDMARFKADIASKEMDAHLERVAKEAEEANIQGTPGIFINGGFLAGFNEQIVEQMMQKTRSELKAG